MMKATASTYHGQRKCQFPLPVSFCPPSAFVLCNAFSCCLLFTFCLDFSSLSVFCLTFLRSWLRVQNSRLEQLWYGEWGEWGILGEAGEGKMNFVQL